jgi:hypothetical protein
LGERGDLGAAGGRYGRAVLIPGDGMAAAKIRDNHFHFDGVNYFRGRAEAVLLGDVGERSTAPTQQNCLTVQANVPRAQLKIRRATQIDVHGIDIDTRDLKVGLTVPGVGHVDVGSVAQQLEDCSLSLVKLEVMPRDIVAAAKQSPQALAELKRAGRAGRLVHQVFLLLENKTAAAVSTAGSLTASGSAGVLTLASGGGRGVTVEVVPGSTFAYLLLKPTSDARLRKDRDEIDDWDDEPWSLY